MLSRFFLETVYYIASLLEENSLKFWTLSVAKRTASFFLCETKLKLIQFILKSKVYETK